jgi:hypothetical protein
MPGNPVIAAETPLSLVGFDPALDGRWVTTTVTHVLDDNGLRTDIDAESGDVVAALDQPTTQ